MSDALESLNTNMEVGADALAITREGLKLSDVCVIRAGNKIE